MKIRKVLFALVVFLSFPALGATTTGAQNDRLRAFTKENGGGWSVRWSADGARVVSLVGKGTARAYRGQPGEAARQFLGQWSGLFGLRPELDDLTTIDERSHLGGASVELQQVAEGLRVENGRVQVNLDKGGHVLMVVSSYVPSQKTPAPATLPHDRATEIAIDRLVALENAHRPGWGRKEPGVVTRENVQLAATPEITDTLFGTRDGLVRAYRIKVRTKVPFAIREFVIDARSGEVLKSRTFIQDIDGQGQVFMPNPNQSQNDNTINTGNVTNHNPNPYFTVPLYDLTQSGGVFHLEGPFVKLEDIDAPSNTPTTEANANDFSYFAGDIRFADVMVYYQLDREQRYIQSLGFIDVNNRQIRADPSGFNGVKNAQYVDDPVGSGYLHFGMLNGTNFVAEDADVPTHEYGHAMQDNQTNGKYLDLNAETQAMAEGFSDYMSVTMFFNENTANGSNPACVGSWFNGGPCFRRADTNLTHDDLDPGIDSHTNGQIWSRALWDLLNNIGKTTTDRLVIQSHFNVPDAPTMKEAADATVTADLQLYSGSHIGTICQAFIDRHIYVAADCPTIPGSTGTQATLVVLARFNDAGLPASPLTNTDVINRVASINDYLSKVTHNQASLGVPTIVGWLNLPHSRAQYYDQTSNNLLVQLAQDVIAAAPAGTDFTTVDRMIIITNDDGSVGETRGLKEWATTGPWPYTLPAAFGTRRMSVSAHRFDHDDAHFNHAMGHHFGLGDLYPHEGVTFPRKYVNGWSNMAQNAAASNFPDTHFFAWEKGRPGWITDAHVQFVARPGAGGSFDQTFPLFKQATAAGSPVAIQVGTTNGVATRGNERVSYYIEARDTASDTYDGNLPQNGVVIYYVNEDIGQGFGPARLVDATPADDDLTNAAWNIGSTTPNIDGSGLVVSVLAPSGGEDYRIRVQYNPPSDQVDAWIHPHDSSWKSPDIWIDSPGCNGGDCGFDADNGRAETDHGDLPIAGQVNRAYARIFNNGPGIAHDVRVDFYFSDPYHGLDGGDVDPDTGGNVAFNKHQFVVIPDLPPTATGVPVFVQWTPEQPPDQDHPHACVKVKIQQVTGDTNPANQASQENLDQYDITSHSPYPPVNDSFKVVNPYDHAILVFLRADNVPAGWTATISPSKAYLPVGGSADATMTIQAPLTYPVCTTELITATAWYPSGDTLVPLGGSTAQVNLKKSTTLTATSSYEPCRPRTLDQSSGSKKCSGIDVKGCTNPPKPFEHITVRYTAPDGTTVYHDVVTDAHGCYEDFYVVPGSGPWSVDTTYQGDDCTAVTHTRPTVVIVPPEGGNGGLQPGGIPRGPFWYSFELGMNFPTGSFAKQYEPGPSLTLDLQYPYRDRDAIVGLFGYHYFHGTDGPNLAYTTLNVDLRHYFPIGARLAFAEIGPGLYRTGGTVRPGANAGLGLFFPITSTFALETAADLHAVSTSASKRLFIDARFGLVWRF